MDYMDELNWKKSDHGPWWRHHMETLSALLAFCGRNPPVTDGFPSQSQWRGALMFSLIYVLTNGWANNRDAGDVRRHRAHHDVIVMFHTFINIRNLEKRHCFEYDVIVGQNRVLFYKSVI